MADADELAGTEGQEPVTERTIEILVAEIPESLQQKAKRRVCLAMDKYDVEKDIATDVKKHFDEECEGSWHCVGFPSLSQQTGTRCCEESLERRRSCWCLPEP
eukprot:jgi/Undpi1/11071/HiC_scaffold_30.g13369.m1